jgi:DNA-binding NarL/FixJ family response regulator
MRVLIIADNALTAEGIRRELRHIPAFRVLGYVDGRFNCSAAIAQAAPDLVTVDEMRNGEDVLERVAEAREAAPNAKLVLLTSQMKAQWLARASAAGIDAAVSKALQSGGLGALIRQVAVGNVFHAFVPAPQPVPTEAHHAGLTERELEILLLVAGGASNARIAAQLWVSEQTVKFHLSNTYRKLGVRNRTEASHYAHVHRLVELDSAAARQAA